MTHDGRYTAVLDRFEDDLCVLVAEDDGEAVAELVVPRTHLPAGARHQDAIFTVVLRDGYVVDLTYEPETTAARGKSAQDRFDRLADRPPDEPDPDG